MKYKKFVIKNYKAIKEVEIDLSKNVIPLIGINESGKTSILHAILAFDQNKDGVLNGEHLKAKNMYLTRQEACSIEAHIVISEEDFDAIGSVAKLTMGDELYEWLRNKMQNSEPIKIQRKYEEDTFQKEYFISEDLGRIIDKKGVDRLTKTIVKFMPYILYFDDFNDRVPDNIVFKSTYINDGKFSTGRDREWQEIIAEIFSRALDERFSLKEFLDMEEKKEQKNWLSDVSDILNAEIVQEWQKLKSITNEEDANLSFRIEYENLNGTHNFSFEVVDKENDGRSRTFAITQRSKGFQWFFNFCVKLKFNPKYKTHPDNAIYLLDEPGSYLHTTAQTELLKKLIEMSQNNTIIYCTHSQYLLDPDIINIADVKIVSKESSSISIESYGESKDKNWEGAFSAIEHALQLKFSLGGNNFKNIIITEGIVDYYFIKMFLGIKNSIKIIPGTGAGQLKDLISIMIAYSNKFLVILDNDVAGRKAYSQYNNHFEKAFSENCYQYQNIGASQDSFVLENILTDEDQQKILEIMKISDIKKAIVSLYYNPERIKEAKNNLSKESKININNMKQAIERHFA